MGGVTRSIVALPPLVRNLKSVLQGLLLFKRVIISVFYLLESCIHCYATLIICFRRILCHYYMCLCLITVANSSASGNVYLSR